MRTALTICIGLMVFCAACHYTPRWHEGKGCLRHHIGQVAVVAEEPDSLSVSGHIDPLVAFTDYGIKVYSATDDKGNKLELRSVQIFWMKAECFEIELSAPDPEANAVVLDLAFMTRSGIQRVTTTLPISRLETGNYLTQSGRWERDR